MTIGILISLDPRHARNVLSGFKKVELRRRTPHVEPGTIVWMYSKMPEGVVVGRAVVKEVHEAAPRTLWNRFKEDVGVSHAEFKAYFEDRRIGAAIELMKAERFKRPISLDELRGVDALFHPPQYFKRIQGDTPVGEVVSAAL